MKPAVGIDIGTYTIKLAQASKQGSSYQVDTVVSVPNSLGVVVPAQDVDREKLIELLKGIFKEHKLPTGNVHLGIPEAFVSTKIVAIPSLSDQELSSAIGWQAEQYIPIPAEDLQLEYQVLYRPPKNDQTALMRVLLLGASKSFVIKYTDIFFDAGLEVTSLETHMLALYKLALLDETLPTTMVVHIGASTMDIFVVHEKELAFVYTYPNGGAVFSRSVERTLGLDAMQAEEYKRTYGLDEVQLEGKIRQAMLPVLQGFTTEIQKALQYFSGSHQGVPVKCILISGGSAAMPNLIPTLAQTFPVEIAPLIPTVQFGKNAQVSQADIPSFTIAMGLAIGGKK